MVPPNVDGSFVTLTEPRQFIILEKTHFFFFLSNGLEKHFFKENLGSLKMDSMKNGFHVWKNNFRSVLALLWMEMSLNLVSLHSNEVNKLIDV